MQKASNYPLDHEYELGGCSFDAEAVDWVKYYLRIKNMKLIKGQFNNHH